MTQQQIAEAFSTGNFELVHPFLTEYTEWTVVADFSVKGKRSIIQRCEDIAAYFQSVETKFKLLNTIVDKNKVAINGTAEFIRDGKRVSFVSSCDIYEFNNDNTLLSITSYCIQEKK